MFNLQKSVWSQRSAVQTGTKQAAIVFLSAKVFACVLCDILVSSHLCGQFFHVGVDLIQDVEALLKQSVLSSHEGQHLQETQACGEGGLWYNKYKTNASMMCSRTPVFWQLTASRISNFFFAWSTLICQNGYRKEQILTYKYGYFLFWIQEWVSLCRVSQSKQLLSLSAI